MLSVETANGTQTLQLLNINKLNFIEWIIFKIFKKAPRNHDTALSTIAGHVVDLIRNSDHRKALFKNSAATQTTLKIIELINRGKSTKENKPLLDLMNVIRKLLQNNQVLLALNKAPSHILTPLETPFTLQAPKQTTAFNTTPAVKITPSENKLLNIPVAHTSSPIPKILVQTILSTPIPSKKNVSLSKKSIFPQEGILKNGFGEYLIYRVTADGRKQAISPGDYQVVFKIIENARVLKGDDFPEDRHAYLKAAIQAQLGPEVQIGFIPRSLYELIYLQECVQEILKNKETLCIDDSNELWKNLDSEEKITEIDKSLTKYFWQQCRFEDTDYINQCFSESECDHRERYVQLVSEKLNKVALEKFNLESGDREGFSYFEIRNATKTVVEFFKNLRDESSVNNKIVKQVKPRDNIAYAMACKTTADPIGIANTRDIQLIKDAVKLECSQAAVNHLIFYRGGKYSSDALEKSFLSDNLLQNSLSYGTLFGGILYDRGACAYRYMRDFSNDSFAYPVSLKKLLEGTPPFTMPMVHPLITMMSSGEYFHGRTVVSSNDYKTKSYGFHGAGCLKISDLPRFCTTDILLEALKDKFAKFQNKVYVLSSSTEG